jgi:hypothetical protein
MSYDHLNFTRFFTIVNNFRQEFPLGNTEIEKNRLLMAN